MKNEAALGLAALWVAVHNLRFMVNRGLVSPAEVDEAFGSICEALSASDPDFAAQTEQKLEPVFLEMKKWAEERWIGKGKTNPR